MSIQQVCAYVLAALIIVSVLLYARIYREVRLYAIVNDDDDDGEDVIARPLSTVGYTSVVASVIHSRQWSN